MAEKIVPINSRQQTQSPFDEIKRFDENGNEFWTARDLMGLLGYRKYERMDDAIARARIACENAGNPSVEHFFPASGSSGGRPREDYKLTRYACYLVAMNGDPRKSEVASAQTYFAIKTREAETVIPAMSEDMRKLELENENMKLKLQVYEAQTRALAAASSLAIVAPAIAEAIVCPGVTIIEKVEHVDRTVVVDYSGQIISQNDGIGITAIQKQFGFSSTKKAWEWLESIGYGKNSGYWKPETTAHDTLKLDRAALKDLKSKFSKGSRQRLIGE